MLVLHSLHGMNHQEIAEQLGITKASVAKTLTRARTELTTQLRAVLEQQDSDGLLASARDVRLLLPRRTN
jgi:DNA-directed RNA polymerase specialized sigma24 family protein